MIVGLVALALLGPREPARRTTAPPPREPGETNGAVVATPEPAPAYREPRRAEPAPPRREPPSPPRPEGPAPRVAIVIDDVGWNLPLLEDLLELEIPVTLAVIPHLPHSAESARYARARGYEVILHQPMEPEEYPRVDPGEGALFSGMREAEVRRIVRKNLSGVPGVAGLNNHMGSRATRDPELMRALLRVLREENLYFVDSRTTARTVAYDVAQEMGVPSSFRAMFLDGEQGTGYARTQLRLLTERAQRDGAVVAIGHLVPSTVQALRESRGWLMDGRVKVVPASRVSR